jgi:hypothetical protein
VSYEARNVVSTSKSPRKTLGGGKDKLGTLLVQGKGALALKKVATICQGADLIKFYLSVILVMPASLTPPKGGGKAPPTLIRLTQLVESEGKPRREGSPG